MGQIDGFINYRRKTPTLRPVLERVEDYQEMYLPFPEQKTITQAARCMDCGVPFCHNGCPLGNIIPEFNEAVYQEDWLTAFEILSSTNNFPEFTGRICPAPCESACVLGINAAPVAIEHIEKSIVEKAYENGWVKPIEVDQESGKKVAIIGSGPAGLATAEELRKTGHEVVVFERKDRLGGLLRYGIPDFKLAKKIIDRRIKLMEASGITFKLNTEIGKIEASGIPHQIAVETLQKNYDALVLAGGSTIPRDLLLPGRNLKGVDFAMDFLETSNRLVAGDERSEGKINVKDKRVIVIGGGDTGADCVGTSNRQGALEITQIELMTKPPKGRSESTPWPQWPMMLRTSSSHEEGCDRDWALLTKEFIGNSSGQLTGLKVVEVDWKKEQDSGKMTLVEKAGTEKILTCDQVLLAVGFTHPQKEGLLNQLGVALSNQGHVCTENYQTSIAKVFAAGDMRMGQSLVVHAIAEGRAVAEAVNEYLIN